MKQRHAIPGSFPLILNPLQGQEVHNEKLICLHVHSFAVHSIMDKVPKELTDGLMVWYNLNALSELYPMLFEGGSGQGTHC